MTRVFLSLNVFLDEVLSKFCASLFCLQLHFQCCCRHCLCLLFPHSTNYRQSVGGSTHVPSSEPEGRRGNNFTTFRNEYHASICAGYSGIPLPKFSNRQNAAPSLFGTKFFLQEKLFRAHVRMVRPRLTASCLSPKYFDIDVQVGTL